jgi:hypothetical protein
LLTSRVEARASVGNALARMTDLEYFLGTERPTSQERGCEQTNALLRPRRPHKTPSGVL